MLNDAYKDGFEAALVKLGLADMVGDTAGNMVAKATAPPEMTRSVDSFSGLATKNRNVALASKRAMPKSMVNSMASVATKVMK